MGVGRGKGLESSGEEGADFFGGILFHCWSNMAVGVQRKSCGVMTQQSGERLYVYAVLKCHRCEGVPQGVEADFLQSCPFEYSVQHFEDAVR